MTTRQLDPTAVDESPPPSGVHRVEAAAALFAPVGLFTYGLFRFLDGLDGDHGPSWAWNVGHVFFLAAMLAFAVLAVAAAVRRRGVSRYFAVLVVAGVAAFTWVILGDLFPAFEDAVGVPDAVMIAGPLMLLVGLLPITALLARESMRWWPFVPLACVLGFVLISADLDLLVPAAVAFSVGLFPLAFRAVDR